MSTLARQLEPEVMDNDQEALDYDAMGHEQVNSVFVDDFLALAPGLGRVLDVGTGTARIPLALWRRAPGARILGVDLAASMLAVGRRNVAAAGAGGAVELALADAKGINHERGAFSAVISNSIVHHIPEPGAALGEMVRVLAPGGVLFVRDLFRPRNEAELQGLVARHAASDTPAQRALFEASLRAALTLEEVRELVAPLGIGADDVNETSDRHWTLAWRAP
jgi:ubiquinone/menaquinone biosynthesis C-methylase UbiE